MKTIMREANENDLSFIFSSWLKSYRNTQKHVDSGVYFSGQHKLIELILQKSHAVIICPEDDQETILGYMVYSGNTLHWIYVKSVFRNLGMAKTLLTLIPFVQQYSHFTAAVYFLFPDKTVQFNPYAHLENL